MITIMQHSGKDKIIETVKILGLIKCLRGGEKDQIDFQGGKATLDGGKYHEYMRLSFFKIHRNLQHKE